MKETFLWTISKRIKHLAITLHKEAKYMHSENFKVLMEEIKQHKQMERYIMLLNWKKQIGKITILPTAMYRFNVITIELPMAVLTVLEQKKFLLISMETQKIPNNQSNLEKGEQSWGNKVKNISKK